MKYTFAVLGTLLLCGCGTAAVDPAIEEDTPPPPPPAVEEVVDDAAIDEDQDAEDADVDVDEDADAEAEVADEEPTEDVTE